MFTVPTIVTSDNLDIRSYVTFYLDNERIREYNGKRIGLRISPNRAKSINERNDSLKKLQLELYKALEAGTYSLTPAKEATKEYLCLSENKIIVNEKLTAEQALLQALNNKLNSKLSRTYKRNLRLSHKHFTAFLTADEMSNSLTEISAIRIQMFLSQFGSSGTYYMNKRRDLAVLFSSVARIIDKPIKTIKDTERRRVKATLHKSYEKDQLKPILNFLKVNYPNMYICCLLTYSSWLRPHEEIRLLTKENFKQNNSEIHLSGDENKGGRVRVVFVPDYVQNEITPILSNLNRTDNLFSLTKEPFNDAYFNTQWTRAWRRMFALGLIYENQTIYSFRHTAAVDLYRRTKDVYLLQKLLGHSTIVVTLKYLRNLGELNSVEMRDAAPQLY